MKRKSRHINKPSEIPGDKPGNGFENDPMATSDDLALFESMSGYMKGRLDIEDVKNDPAYAATKDKVNELVLDYYENIKGNEKNGKFIRDIFSERRKPENLNEAIKNIKQEIKNNKLDEITSEWVKEWHEKKQKNGAGDQKSEEIRGFISKAINSSETGPEKKLNEVNKNSFISSRFVRYASLSAAALLGVFMLVRTLLPSSDPEKLFLSNYEPYDAISPVTRNLETSEADNYSSSIGKYKTADYQGAAIGFAANLQKDPSRVSSQFFLGLSQLALGNFDQAIDLLIVIANDQGEYGKEARWYLGLSYLKTDNKLKAIECFEYLAKSDGFYRERSEKVLRRLK